MAHQKYEYDLIVLGSGGGGSVAAHIAAQSGKRVAIVESAQIGGESPNWNTIPIQALLETAQIYDSAKRAGQLGIRAATLSYNYPSIKSWKDLVVRRTGTTQGQKLYENEGIKLISGIANFIGTHEVTANRRHYSAEHFLVATGTHDFIPPIEGLDKTGFLTFREAIDLIRPPRSLFIIGGGATGCEFAELFSIFGTKIYIADINPRLLMQEDEEVGELLREIFENERGMHVLTNAKVIKTTKEGLNKRVYFQQGTDLKSVKVDEILIATGRIANVDIGLENAGVEYTPRGIIVNEYMQTSAKHIFAAGNVVGPYPLPHMAIYQSRLAANNIFHKQKIAADYRAVPRCIFLSPEIASVGLTEEECIKRDMQVKKAISPITVIGRSNTSNTDRGFVKVIANKDNKLIGASIVCPQAGEIIHELTLAIQHNMTAADIAMTIHAFPSWSEAVRTACNKLLRPS